MLIQGKLDLIKNFSKSDLLHCAFLGLLNPCLYYIILFKGYDVLPAQEAMVINFSWPIMIVILSIPILKQKIDIKSFLSIIVCYVGVVVIASKGDVFSMQFENSVGVVYILITTVIWSLFWLFNTKNSNDSVVSLFLIFLFSLPYILMIFYWSDSFVIPSLNGEFGIIDRNLLLFAPITIVKFSPSILADLTSPFSIISIACEYGISSDAFDEEFPPIT